MTGCGNNLRLNEAGYSAFFCEATDCDKREWTTGSCATKIAVVGDLHVSLNFHFVPSNNKTVDGRVALDLDFAASQDSAPRIIGLHVAPLVDLQMLASNEEVVFKIFRCCRIRLHPRAR